MIPNSVTYSVVAGGLVQAIDLDALYDEIYIRSTGTVTLVGPVTITPDPRDTPTDDLIIIRWTARCALNGQTVTVFGVGLDQEMVMNDLRIECKYDSTSAAWKVIVMEDATGIPFGNPNVATTAILAAGVTATRTAGINEKWERFTSAAALVMAGSVSISGAGSPVEGDEFHFIWDATLVLGANTVTIFGASLTALQALSGAVRVDTVYDGGAWRTTVVDRYHVDKFRLMGSAADTAPAFLDTKVKNSIEVNANQAQLVGDSLAPGAGYMYSTDSGGTKGWFPIATNLLMYADLTIAHADILTLYTVPQMIVASPGAGKKIMVTSAAISLVGNAGVWTPYTTGLPGGLIVNLITSTATVAQTIFAVHLELATADMTGSAPGSCAVNTTTDTGLVANQALYVQCQSANPTGGGLAGQSIVIRVFYTIIDI